VPIAVKDVLTTKGVPTTCGSKILEGWRPPYDATIVSRMRQPDGHPRQDEHGRVRDGIVH
jgi:Asp-tRNA(Asn)/Glu-tRNA(Gln) amidotransferase A subunit family amidase